MESNYFSTARISLAFGLTKSPNTQIYCRAQKDVTKEFVAKNTEILDDYTLRIKKDSESFLCGQGDSNGFKGT